MDGQPNVESYKREEGQIWSEWRTHEQGIKEQAFQDEMARNAVKLSELFESEVTVLPHRKESGYGCGWKKDGGT